MAGREPREGGRFGRNSLGVSPCWGEARTSVGVNPCWAEARNLVWGREIYLRRRVAPVNRLGLGSFRRLRGDSEAGLEDPAGSPTGSASLPGWAPARGIPPARETSERVLGSVGRNLGGSLETGIPLREERRFGSGFRLGEGPVFGTSPGSERRSRGFRAAVRSRRKLVSGPERVLDLRGSGILDGREPREGGRFGGNSLGVSRCGG